VNNNKELEGEKESGEDVSNVLHERGDLNYYKAIGDDAGVAYWSCASHH
jgi:hypothetical protein